MASCSPVDAPLGTAARPVAPLSSVTSASMVGLPRLSRISRATTSSIVDIDCEFWCGSLFGVGHLGLAPRRVALDAVNRSERVNDLRPNRLSQLLTIGVVEACSRHRLEQMYIELTGTHQHGAFREHVVRTVKQNGDDRYAGGDRKDERALLERSNGVIVTARPLWKNHTGVTRPDLLRRHAIGCKGGFAILPLDWDHTNRPDGRTEHRDFEQLCLRDELVARQRAGQGGNVEPAQVIGQVQARLAPGHAL